eukprot:CAMPEP_0171292886 /NCGR_PEP_ID=MMETSP0816-20121228/901_1 /TAXON_ID=420281 /ORGANISM="Proboscia inermis, Strain CCAP1064/1" /LENGTH=138 /DNA_ID=CAMNT_0011763093 /DNA_START=84 /DNA_END=500 /DNA_ORIENTATION=-
MDSSIPIMRSPANIMSGGVNGGNLSSAAIKPHPVDRMQRASQNNQMDYQAIRQIYGSGLAMVLATERKTLASVGGRLPGLDGVAESNALLDTVTANDVRIGFADYMNLPCYRPEVGGIPGNTSGGGDVHYLMETRLGL